MLQMFSLSTGYGSSAPCVRESCYSTPGWGGDGGLGSSGLIPEPLNTLWVHTWWNTQLSIKLGKQWWAGAQHRIWPMELLWHTPPSQLQPLWLCICTVYHFGSKSTITQTLSKHSCTAVDPADPSLKAKHPGLAQEVIQAIPKRDFLSPHFPSPSGVTWLPAFRMAQGHG